MRVITIYGQAQDDVRKKLEIAPKEMRKGIKEAVNEIAKESREELYKGARREYTLRAGRFRKSDIRLKKAVVSRLEAMLEISGGPETIKEAYRNRKNGVRKGVQTEIKRGSGLKELKMKDGTLKAFVAGVTTGHTDKIHHDVFQREKESRLPIKTIHGPGRAKISEVLWRELEER